MILTNGNIFRDRSAPGALDEIGSDLLTLLRGFAWDGDECHFEWFKEADIMECLKDSTSHFYGDSQLRRVAKTIVSGGKTSLRGSARTAQHSRNGMITKF